MSILYVDSYNYLDPAAATYIAAVEAADGQGLESPVKEAINAFVVGCKADGIWSAIKASCILAGARTLTGALVPLVGTAPTNNNFASGDYNRETGLVGNGTTKYLDTNRTLGADPQNSQHAAVYASTVGSSFLVGMNVGPTTSGATTMSNTSTRSRSSSNDSWTPAAGFLGISRAAAASYTQRTGGTSTAKTRTSQTPATANVYIFACLPGGGYSAGRFAFYSIGEALDLALLDGRVTALINAIAAAIP